jgi:outer membrane protein
LAKAAADAAARQATIQREQERLAAQRAEEARKTAEKTEQERITVLKSEEERFAAARRAITTLPRPEIATPAQQTVPASPVADSQAAPSLGARPAVPVKAELLLEQHQPVESAQPEKSVRCSLDLAENPDIGVDNTTGETPATIQDLFLSAKANDPALGRTVARVSGSKADSDQLLSTLLPHLDSTAGVQQISQTLKNYSSTDAGYDFTSLSYNVTARMILLNIPTIYSLSAAAASLRVEQEGVVAARQNLIVKFTDSYFALLKAQTDKRIAKEEIYHLKQVLNQSQAFLKAGTGDIIAVYEAQSRLDGARADLNKSESNLRLAEQKLSTVVGKPVTSIVNYLPQQPTGPDPDDLDWWVATMEKEQPVIRQAREGLAQVSEQRKSAKSEYLPVIQASGGYDVNRGAAALPTAEVRQWFVGATLSLPLYSGGETAAKVRRAVASEEERKHIFDETMDQQRENVKQAFFNLRYNVSFIKALEQRKTSAEIQLSAVNKGRKIGTRNAIDLLNAEQAYSLALRDYKYALYDNFIKIIQLKSAAGILAETDISAISREAVPILSSGLRQFPSGVSIRQHKDGSFFYPD